MPRLETVSSAPFRPSESAASTTFTLICPPPFRRIFHGIGHEVQYDLLHAVLVHIDSLAERCGLDGELVSPCLCDRLEQKTYFLDESGEVNLDDMERDDAVVIFTEIGDGLNVFLKDFRRLVHEAQAAQGRLSEVGVLKQLLDRSRDEGERCADFVEEVGVEFQFVFVAFPLFLAEFSFKFAAAFLNAPAA